MATVLIAPVEADNDIQPTEPVVEEPKFPDRNLKLSPSRRFKTIVRGGQYRRSARNLSVSTLSNILFPSLHERIYEPGRVLRRVDGETEEDQLDDDYLDGVEAECCSHRCIAFCCDEKCVTFCCEDGISDTDENARSRRAFAKRACKFQVFGVVFTVLGVCAFCSQIPEERLRNTNSLSLIGGVASTLTGSVSLLSAWRKERCIMLTLLVLSVFETIYSMIWILAFQVMLATDNAHVKSLGKDMHRSFPWILAIQYLMPGVGFVFGILSSALSSVFLRQSEESHTPTREPSPQVSSSVRSKPSIKRTANKDLLNQPQIITIHEKTKSESSKEDV